LILFFILYRLEPDRTLATNRLSGRKKNKERLSIALCTNADGSHKLNPLIIGKFGKPRCFKNININNLPMTYCYNTKAWMLSTVFQDWLQEFNREVAQKYNQRVLLLLDNCPSHKIDGLVLSHVDVHFLPPNTTSKIQPMDAGIIMSFKKHYRHLHIKWILNQVEDGNDIKDLKMDVLQAIQYIIKSWEEITPETICNCWQHTKILPAAIDTASNVGETNIPTLEELSDSIGALNLSNAMQIDEFLNNPEEGMVYEVPDNDDKIIEGLVEIFKKQLEVPIEDIEDDKDDSIEPVVISASEASKSLKTVYAFLLQEENSSEQLKMANALDKFINLKKINRMKQTTMYDFINQ